MFQLFKLSNKAIDKLPVNIATNLPNGFDMLKRTGSKENFIVTLVLHSLTIYSAEWDKVTSVNVFIRELNSKRE